jgi:hypothetical protein
VIVDRMVMAGGAQIEDDVSEGIELVVRRHDHENALA